jgi:hypothetical protein
MEGTLFFLYSSYTKSSRIYYNYAGEIAWPGKILHRRWLMGWLPIVNYTGARQVADDVPYTTLYTIKEQAKGVAIATLSTPLNQPL